MNNVILNWKIISKGLPIGAQNANDRIPIIDEILDRSGRYSDSMKKILGHMANAYEDLAYGLAEPGIDSYKFKE